MENEMGLTHEGQDYTDFKDPTNSKNDVLNGEQQQQQQQYHHHQHDGGGGDYGPDEDYNMDPASQYSGPSRTYSGNPNIHVENPNDTYNVFVGDINLDVTEEDLKETFSPCGPVKSVLIFRDRVTNEPKGFGFVHFISKAAQQVALSEEYNHIQIKGRPCRVRPEQKTTLFVGNIPKMMGPKEVYDGLAQLVGPNIEVELKTGPPPLSESRGFAFVTFGNHQTADKARKVLVSSAIRERPLNVSWAEPQEDADADTMSTVKTLYVNNLNASVTDNVLGSLFSQYGPLVNCAVVKNPQTKDSRGFAFVEFKTRESCISAMDALNGAQLEGQPLSIVLAKPPPKPNTSSKGCYRCGGEGHISRDCPNDPGYDKGGRSSSRSSSSRSSDRGSRGGSYREPISAPQFNSSGAMNPYIYDPDTQQYIYLDQSQFQRIKSELSGGSDSHGPMRHGRSGGGKSRSSSGGSSGGNGGGTSSYTAYSGGTGYYQPTYDYSQGYQQQQATYQQAAAGYPTQQYAPQYQYSQDYQQAQQQPAATQQYPETFAQNRFAPY